jgi:hypothetical protein
VEGAYICERDGSSFSRMGNSALVEAVNEAVMSGCDTHAIVFDDDRVKIMSLLREIRFDLFAE